MTWEIVDIPSWLDVSPQSGGNTSTRQTTEVTVTPNGLNPTSSVRTAELLIRSTSSNYKFEKTVTVSQEASRPYAYFITDDGTESSGFNSSSKASFFGETMTFKYVSNCGSNLSIEAEFDNSSAAMGQTLTASINVTDNTISVNVPQNTYTGSRKIILRLKSKEGNTLYATCYFTQIGPGLTLHSKSTQEISSQAQSFVINFDSTLDWSVSTSSDWVTFSPSGGTKGKDLTLTVYVTENLKSYSRSCTVYIQTVSGNYQTYFTIYQNGVSLKLSKDYYAVHENVPDDNGDLTITASAPWSIKSSPSWATIDPERGPAGETKARVKVDYIAWNKGLEYREGEIVIQIDGTTTTQSIKIRQYY